MPLDHIEGNSVNQSSSEFIWGGIHWSLYTEPNLRRRTIIQRGAALLLSIIVFICSWHVQLSIQLTYFHQGHHSTFLVKETFMLQMTVENGATGDLGDMAPELKKMSLSPDCSVKCKRLLVDFELPSTSATGRISGMVWVLHGGVLPLRHEKQRSSNPGK